MSDQPTPQQERAHPVALAAPVAGRRGRAADMALLTLACLISFFYGPTRHGLTNWQESQRALVVREMQAAGEWIVPTINGQPYLAKPPMFYWVQLALAKVTGGVSGELELRLAVALAGLLGVLATYLVTRSLMERDPPPRGTRIVVSAREAALWAGLFLATGPLYVRSSRIGELDIWLAPFVVIGVWGVLRAWHTGRTRGRTDVFALAVAALAGAGAALTKGPPGVAVIAAAGYGPIILVHALAPRPGRRGPGALAIVLTGLAAGVAAAIIVPKVDGVRDAIGAAIIMLLCGGMGWVLGRAMEPPALREILRSLGRTHPLLVLGTPLVALWSWGRLAAARIGPDVARFWAEKETEDNLQVFVPASPLRNLEAMAFGVGIGSFAAIAALFWLLWRRPRWSPRWAVPVVWVVLGFAIFSLLGKGIGRYLTPLWPGVAMLGGIFVATIFARDPGGPRIARRARIVLGVVVAAGVLVSGWWYGEGRERYFAQRSPRAIVAELRGLGIKPSRMVSFEFYTAALDFYAGERVEPVGEIQIRDVTAGGKPLTIEELRDLVVTTGPMVVLMRENQRGITGLSERPAAERLGEIGLRVEPIPLSSRFAIDAERSRIVAARLTVEP